MADKNWASVLNEMSPMQMYAQTSQQMMNAEMIQRLLGTMNVSGVEPPLKYGPAAEQPSGAAVIASVEAAELTEYAALAADLGYAPKHLIVERFKGFLSSLGLTVYDRAKVAAFLNNQWGIASSSGFQTRVPWCWRPMRQADTNINTNAPTSTDQLARHLQPYDKPIPMPVLVTAKRVKDAFPDARFFVSDLLKEHEQPRNPDPFLMVELGGECFIVERWDEPSFRG